MGSSNDALAASRGPSSLKLDREILLLGGGSLGGGEEGDEGVHFS